MGCGYSCGMEMSSMQSQRYLHFQRYIPLSMVPSPTDQARLNLNPSLIPSFFNQGDMRNSYQALGSSMPYASIEQGHSAAHIKACDRDNRPAAAKYGNLAYWNVSGV